MFASLLTTIRWIPSVRSRFPGVPCWCSPWWSMEETCCGRKVSLLVILSILVVALMACTPSATVPLPQAASTLATDSNAGLALPTPGQKLEFEQISVEQGLSQGTVTCVLQDSLGFMWFCTEEGLNRYDGYGFEVYRHDPQNPNSLSHNQVTALAEDREGILWIATNGGGLDRYDRRTGVFRHYRHEAGNRNSLLSDRLSSLLFADDGVLWIGTAAGLDRFEPAEERFTHYSHESGVLHSLSGSTVESIYQDREGMLWVGTNGSGLNRLDPTTGRFARFQHDPNDPDSLISNCLIDAIYEDEAGNLWVGTFDGLDRLDRQSGRFAHYQHDPGDPDSLSNNRIASLEQGPSGRLWVGTLGGGLDILDPTTGRFVHHVSAPGDPRSLSGNIILSLYKDRTGVMWVGTAGGGVNRLDPLAERFTLYRNDPDDPNSLANDVVQAVLQDRQGNLWIGTLGSGLSRLDRETGTWHLYEHDPTDPLSLSSNAVSSICEDRDGLLWIGTFGGGLNQFDPEMQRFTDFPLEPDHPNGLGNPFVYSILEDRNGGLWIATDAGAHGGLHRFDRETGRFTHIEHGLTSNWVRALYEDRSGVLWISTAGAGLNRFDPATGSVSHYPHNAGAPNGLSHASVTAIHEDQQGELWLGTNGGGLNRLDRQSDAVVHYTTEDGLPSDVIYGILEEDPGGRGGPGTRGGTLWISTNNGLSKFDPSTETFRNYDTRDGLQGNVFSVRAHYKGRDGEMFFGGLNGLTAFNPEQIVDNPIAPPVVLTTLTQLSRNGEDVTLGTAAESARQIVLHWPNNAFEFEFAALNFIQPDKNQHAYKLEGFDQVWNQVGTLRYGKYTNLPAGTYTLRMIGSNNDGLWNEEGASVSIRVVPPFWGTWWFRGLVLLVLLGTGFGAYRLRVRSLEARSRELEQQVTERTLELREEIDQRIRVEEALRQSEREAATASERNRLARELHDSVAQSMYGVVLLAEVASQLLSSKQAEAAANYLGELKDTAQESLAEMRLLIYELRPPVLEEEGLASALQSRLEAVESRAGLRTEFQAEGHISLNPEVEEALYRIAQEALNNALKHAQARRIVVSLIQDQRHVTLEIADDGSGLDPTAASRGGGMGLQGMRERADEIGARLELESVEGSGTIVRVVWEADEGSATIDD